MCISDSSRRRSRGRRRRRRRRRRRGRRRRAEILPRSMHAACDIDIDIAAQAILACLPRCTAKVANHRPTKCTMCAPVFHARCPASSKLRQWLDRSERWVAPKERTPANCRQAPCCCRLHHGASEKGTCSAQHQVLKPTGVQAWGAHVWTYLTTHLTPQPPQHPLCVDWSAHPSHHLPGTSPARTQGQLPQASTSLDWKDLQRMPGGTPCCQNTQHTHGHSSQSNAHGRGNSMCRHLRSRSGSKTTVQTSKDTMTLCCIHKRRALSQQCGRVQHTLASRFL